ncbi:hypothetical protein [Agromyces badenianii]|uniref:hypothetical protein n=1 Tax=Agromyces badenianii TaxID=2080742 RepID=UPI000D59D416|nr:hypothetical protein [Agromyces badenianii]PWC04325.1 hypothetical protein DCE94_09255 [Agromyces badenianii]
MTTKMRMTAIAAAALIVGGVSIGAANAASENSTDAASRVEKTVPAAAVQPPVAPAATETTALAATPAPAAALPPNGSSGVLDGIPFYDANSDPTLIQYPADVPEEEHANARAWVEMMTITAKCMATKGHPFQYTLWWDIPADVDPSLAARLRESPAKHGTPAFEALYGDPFAADYDPQLGAGCHGEARAQLG